MKSADQRVADFRYLSAAASVPQLAGAQLETATLSPAATYGVASVIPLTELERRAIMNALEYTKGDRAVAAHLLGIGRTTLYRKLKEYNLVTD